MKFITICIITLLWILGAAACSAQPTSLPPAVPNFPALLSTSSPTPTFTSVPANTAPASTSTTAPPTLTPTPLASGPDDFPASINPLTGLPLLDPSLLNLAPALVSISNSPETARPQAGLSYASQVYELYLGEGASRFLAVFYGEMPPTVNSKGKTVEVGPLRSGRIPYETLRQFYNGFLVFASAAERVLERLDQYYIVQNPDLENINGATIPVNKLLELGKEMRSGSSSLTGNRFDPIPPADGKPAQKIWIPIHYYDQVFWKYSPALQGYTRWQDDGEGTPLRQFTDRINGQPLAFENVVVLFTNYTRYTETYFDIEFKFIHRWPALLFRDGQMYEIYWTTRSEDFEKRTGKIRPPRYIDYEGHPFPLKPGQTWIEIIQLHNIYYETVDSEDYYRLKNSREPGSGVWAVFFSPPEPQEE